MMMFLVHQFTWAQETVLVSDKERKINLKIGYAHFRTLDRQVTSLKYRANSINIGLGYDGSTADRIFRASFDFHYGGLRTVDFKSREFLTPTIDNEGGIENEILELASFTLIEQNLKFEYLKKLKSINNSNLTYYLGANFHEFFSLSLTRSANFVTNEIGVGPSFFARYTINEKFKAEIGVSVPLIGLMVRMPYANDPADGKNGTFKSVYTMGTNMFLPNKYQRINFNFSLEKELNENWDIGLGYSFYWFHYNNFRHVSAYNNCVQLKISRTLKMKK